LLQPPKVHLFGQHLLHAKMRSSRQPRSQQLFLQPQPLPQAALPPSQEGSMPQDGAGAAQVGAGAAQAGAAQLGAAQPGAAFAQPLLQLLQRLLQRDLQHFVSQQLLSQPQPLEPSIMSSSSKE
jgi:hypothetical protein